MFGYPHAFHSLHSYPSTWSTGHLRLTGQPSVSVSVAIVIQAWAVTSTNLRRVKHDGPQRVDTVNDSWGSRLPLTAYVDILTDRHSRFVYYTEALLISDTNYTDSQYENIFALCSYNALNYSYLCAVVGCTVHTISSIRAHSCGWLRWI